MRINLFGGVLAFDYMLAGWLRSRGVDAHYYFNLKHSEGDYPWWEDPSFDRHQMPDWCHFYPFRVPYLYRAPLGRTGRAFIRDFDVADLLVVIGEGTFLTHHFRRPYAVWSCGFEVEVAVPGPVDWSAALGRLRGRHEPVNLQRALNHRHVARALRRAQSVISVMEFQVPTYLRQAGVIENVCVLPMMYDCTRYRRSPDPALDAMYAAENVVFFLPTRHTYDTYSTNDKGADKVIRAFARFLGTGGNARLILVDKGIRVEDSKAAVASLGISHRVDWVPHLEKERLKNYYSIPNVVVLDQFQNESTIEPALHAAMRQYGARGSIFAEAMCIGAPVVSNVGVEWLRRFEPRPFIWDACSEDEIVAAMHAVALVPGAERRSGGEANRAWAFEHLHWERIIDEYILHFESLVRRQRGAIAS